MRSKLNGGMEVGARPHARIGGALGVVLLLVFGLTLSVGGSVRAGGLPPGGTFVDDDGNTHEGFIEAIAAAGVTQGCDAEAMLYCPNGLVTRGQMASFLARALDLPAATMDWFADDNGSTHEANINAVASAGITQGFTDGTFRPDGTVRRDQMASFIARGVEGLTPPSDDYFSDDAGNVHEDNINTMAENGITLGCDNTGTAYCPDTDVRRDQMASFLGRALNLTEIIPPPPTSTTSTTDGSTSTSDGATTSTSDGTTSTSGGTTSTSGATTTSTTDAPETKEVDVLDNSFDPAVETINVGDTIVFTKGTTSQAHNVNFADPSIDDSGTPTTAPFTHPVTFTTAGTYTYVCDVHAPGMSGTIIVNP